MLWRIIGFAHVCYYRTLELTSLTMSNTPFGHSRPVGNYARTHEAHPNENEARGQNDRLWANPGLLDVLTERYQYKQASNDGDWEIVV